MAVSLNAGKRDMKLTQTSRLLSTSPSLHSDERFPVKQLILLAICRVAEPIALTSILPYAWLLVKSFHVGNGGNDASFYAGILISAFSFAECLTGVFWGSMSDRFGRKPILLLGCAGTVLSLLIVGLSTNFWVALLGRVVGGLLNGNVGVIQTMVAELVKKPEHEPRAYAVMPFFWSVGTIVGPVIGGTFANPSKYFPQTFSPDGLFGQYPYLLPNVICAMLMLISIVLGWLFLEETNSALEPGLSDIKPMHVEGIVANAAIQDEWSIAVRSQSYGTFDGTESPFDDDELDLITEKPISRDIAVATGPTLWCFQIIMLLTALGLFTYHSMTFDHLLPIFLQASEDDLVSPKKPILPPGLGMSTFQVGTILSIQGLCALFVQGVVFPVLASWMSVHRLLLLVTFVHPVAYMCMPFLAVLPSNLVYPGIYTALVFRNFAGIIAYPLLLILIKENCPGSSVLGKLNGLAASVGAACRMIAPPMAGYLYAVGSDMGFAGLAWWGSAFAAVLGIVQIFLVRRNKRVDSYLVCETNTADGEVYVDLQVPAKDVVNITVISVDEQV